MFVPLERMCEDSRMWLFPWLSAGLCANEVSLCVYSVSSLTLQRGIDGGIDELGGWRWNANVINRFSLSPSI